MDIKGGQEQAGCFHNSGFALARAGDQLSRLPHPTVLHTDLGNVSNVDQGPGGFAARERGMGGGPGEQHENTKRQLGMLRSCRASFREGGCSLWRGQKAELQVANQQRSLPVPVTLCLWKQNSKCSFAIKLSLISKS